MNIVTLHLARLVPRLVTVFGRVNHPGAEPGTQAYSAWAHPLSLWWNLYMAKAGRVNRHITWHTSPCPWSRSVCWMPGWWLASGDQRRLMGSGDALEACSQYKWPRLLYFLYTDFRWTSVTTPHCCWAVWSETFMWPPESSSFLAC